MHVPAGFSLGLAVAGAWVVSGPLVYFSSLTYEQTLKAFSFLSDAACDRFFLRLSAFFASFTLSCFLLFCLASFSLDLFSCLKILITSD